MNKETFAGYMMEISQRRHCGQSDKHLVRRAGFRPHRPCALKVNRREEIWRPLCISFERLVWVLPGGPGGAAEFSQLTSWFPLSE